MVFLLVPPGSALKHEESFCCYPAASQQPNLANSMHNARLRIATVTKPKNHQGNPLGG
jgi:hypothetical protein